MAKNFKLTKESPALAFLQQGKNSGKKETAGGMGKPAAPAQEQAPDGFKANPMYVEKKSRRVQLLTKPSVYERLYSKAKEEGRSINDLINSILEKEVASY